MFTNKINDLIDLLSRVLSDIYQLITTLTGEQIALLSVFISFIIYILGKHSELNLKKYESKKQQYVKLIELLEKIFSQNMPKDKSGTLKITPELKRGFFDLGSSLLLYGSKKLYKQYIFYREIAGNPLVLKSKYYDDEIIVYVMADMLTTIRKEVGLNKLDSITAVEALAFFVNNIANNPFSKIKSYRIHYKIKMIKFELFLIDRIKFVHIQKLFNIFIRPIFGILYLLFKYLILFPIGKCIIKLFPSIEKKFGSLNYEIKDVN